MLITKSNNYLSETVWFDYILIIVYKQAPLIIITIDIISIVGIKAVENQEKVVQ